METKAIFYDYAIVGQGIAGTLLAWNLHKQGKKVLIIDDNYLSSSSIIAAGIVNPITGKNFTLSWRINEFLPTALDTYEELSQFLGIKTYTKANIIRALHSVMDENTWLSRTSDPLINQYMVASADFTQFEGKVERPFGYGELTQSFYVHIYDILTSFRDRWKERGDYIHHKFDYDSLKVIENGFTYKQHSFGGIVFCEGYKAIYNPFFKDIGLAPSKGEILIIHIEGSPFSKMYKDGIFIVRQPDGNYWVGSGYEWNTTNENPSEKHYNILVQELHRILKVPFQILSHKAAIRPTMLRRRPIFLVHASISGMYLFNGLGTKGSSIGPYTAKKFAQYLINRNPLDLVLN
jgi:glycine/D-amino acid oxidase-like deaminating enzyme